MHISSRQHFFDHLAQTSDFPLAIEIEKAEGIYLYGPKGESYIDFISGIGVSNVGHRHPTVVEAIKAQVDQYMHLMVYGEYVQSPQTQLARALTETLAVEVSSPSPFGFIDNIFLTNSGTEATEGAMKLAKRFTGRPEIISFVNAYHGASQGALSLVGQEFFKTRFRPLLPDTRLIERDNFADLQKITTKTAAVFIEVIGGEAGIRVSDKQYLKALRERCTKTGTLLVIDEIQTGFGRTGTFWAFEDMGIYPDILLSAKGMGGGMPIGAFMASQQVMSVFKNNPILGHITTFGGHPVSAAAAYATLTVIRTSDLAKEATRKGALIRQQLQHPLILDVRGKGLMIAVEFESFDLLKKVIDRCIEKGLITDWFLFCDNSMRIAPPLVITDEEILQACQIITTVLKEVEEEL
jgi:acetylornithine/succinyldiaminopimelate/putrescine aminotransferase